MRVHDLAMYVIFTVIIHGCTRTYTIEGAKLPSADILSQCTLADLIFVLDSSGSIGEENWIKELDFIKSIVSDLPMGAETVQVGIVTYGNQATIQFHLNQYQTTPDLLDAIDRVPWKNENTNTSGGLRVMRQMFRPEHGDRDMVPNVAIVITDGEGTRDANLTAGEAALARNAGISIFALGIGSQIKDAELLQIANSPASEFVFNVDNFDMLAVIRSMLVEQTCRQVLECAEFNDVVFILDSSGSVGEENFELVKGFVHKLFNESLSIAPDLVRVGLMTFSSLSHVNFDLGDFMESSDALDALGRVPYMPGTTNTAEALWMAREQMFKAERGERADRRNVIVLITDGGSNDYELTVDEALKSKISGIEILVVAITDWVNMHELRAIVSDPDDNNIFQVKNFNEIGGIGEDLQVAMCAEPNRCSLRPCENGGSCIAHINQYHCSCPEGRAGNNCQYACGSSSDLVILLDSSSSIGAANWYKVIAFTKSLIDNINGGDTATRVALASFSSEPRIHFHLNEYRSRREYYQAADVPYIRGTTNTASAIRLMQEQMFLPVNGGRDGVRKLAILLTDGRSNDKDDLLQESVAARGAGTSLIVIGVGIGGEFGQRELRSVASNPVDKTLINVEGFDDLLNRTETILSTVLEAVCNNINDCENANCGEGNTCTDQLFTYECQCTTGKTGKNCERMCYGEADVVFAVDVSGSIRENRFNMMKEWLSLVVENLEISGDKTRVALLTFSDNAEVHFDLRRYQHRQDVIKGIDSLEYSRGSTNIAAALGKMRVLFSEELGDRNDVPNFGILITDGEATVFRELTLPEAIQARINGIHLMVVAPQSDFRRLEHLGIASSPAEQNIFLFESFNDMSSIVEPFIMGMCDDVDECLSSPCLNAAQCVNGLHQYICLCRDEYTGINCERRCTRRQDVVFVLDSSGSTNEIYSLAIAFTKHIVTGLNFAGGRTRVGILTYGDEPQVRFHLNTYNTRDEVINGIAFLKMTGRTNTADAIKTAADDMFATVNGDRAGDRNVMIVVSDGFSTVNFERTVDEARDAQNQGIRIISVGSGTRTNMVEVEAIASSPSVQNSFYFSDVLSLEESANAILDSLCA